MRIRIFTILSILAFCGMCHSALSQVNTFPYRWGFNNGLDGWENSSHLVAEWTVGQGNTARKTDGDGFITGPDAALEGSGYAFVNMVDHPVPGKEVAIVKTFDLSSLTNPIITMYAYSLWTKGDGASLTISARETGDMYFRDLITQYENKGDDWYRLNSCLSRYAGKPSVEIKISVKNNGSKPPNIAIDDLLIEDFVLKTSVTDASCYGGKDGSVKVTAIGGGPLYQYSIDHEVTYEQSSMPTYQKNELKAGTYATFVIDMQSGCKATDLGVQVKQPPEIQVNALVSDLTCYGDNSGKLEITAREVQWSTNVSKLPYEYSIDGGLSYQYSNKFENLTGGTYKVMVRNRDNCVSDPKFVDIGQDVLLEFATVTAKDIERCYGDNTGEIHIQANFGPGNAPLDYSVDGGRNYHNSLNSFSGLTAGTYNLVIKDRNGCTVELDSNVVLHQPDKFDYEGITPMAVDGCYGDKNGSITLSVSGGTIPYTYSINKGITYETTNKFRDLAAGTYKAICRDAMGCLTEERDVEITQPEKLKIISVHVDNVQDCYGDKTGHIEITAQGGTGTLKYEVNAILSKLQADNDFYGLAAGEYLPYVVDEKRCFDVGEYVKLDQPAKFVIASASKYDGDIRCHGDREGIIYTLANGGTLPYTYTIDGYATSKTTPKMESCTFDKLTAGKYTVQARDGKGCKAENKELELHEPDLLKITGITLQNVNCHGEKSGSVTLTATGGIDGYSYGYSRNHERTFRYVITPTIENLGAETYDFSVKDANGCLAYKNDITIYEPDELEFMTINTYPVTGCHGDENGSIILGAKGGVTPYRYSIDGGETYQKEFTFTGLPGGNNYIPAVIDDHGCFVIAQSETIGEPSEIRINTVNSSEVAGCKGSKAGSITMSAQGGTGKLTYMANSFVSTDGKFQKLAAGSYNLVVFDERGCSVKQDGVVVEEPDEMRIVSTSTVNENCYGQSIGSFTIKAAGGREFQSSFPYKFYLDDSQNPNNYDGQYVNLKAGKYKYRLEDKYGCTLDGRFTITEPDEFIISRIDSSDVLTCNGHKTGYIKVITKGGVQPLMITATGINYYKETTDGVFDNLGANQYELLAIDAKNCKADAYVTLTEPSKVNFEAKQTKDILCFENGNAEIETKAWGGNEGYSFSLDGGKTYSYEPGTIKGIGEGVYMVKVRDSHNCESAYQREIRITRPNRLVISAEGQDLACHEGNTGRILSSAMGGTRPYQFSLDNINWQENTGVFSKLSDGTYTVYVRDLNMCQTNSEEITITRPDNKAGFSVDVSEGCSPLEIVLTQDHEGLANYTISNGDLIFNRTGPTRHTVKNPTLEEQTYKITSSLVIDNTGGCTDTASLFITVYPKPKVDFVLLADSLQWPNNTIQFMNTSKNHTTALWDFGDGTTSENISESSHEYATCGYYNVVLIETDGRCADTTEHSIKIEGRPIKASFLANKTEGCEPITVKFENTSENSDSCLWDFGDGVTLYNALEPQHTFKSPGNYNVTLTLFGDCGQQTSTTKNVEVYNKPTAAFSQNQDTLYSDQLLRLYCESAAGSQYLWKFGDGQTSNLKDPVHEYGKDGVYDIQLIVTTDRSCVDTAEVKGAVVVIKHPVVVFPTAFSPNSDGINDTFGPVHGDVKEYEIIIMNHKGNVMFQSNNINEGWDGTRNGIHCPPGLYVYKAKITMRDDKFYHVTGKIILLR
ncbi:MAG: PKD domain-containing protein [Bacteroidales bacterium]|nr:PKD domain-containing protein [Bacteroidales bacterium]